MRVRILWGVLLLICGAAPAIAEGAPERWIVPQGREADVMALLQPLGLLTPTKSGPLLKDASIEGGTLTVTVIPKEGAEVIGQVTVSRVSAAELRVEGEGVPAALVDEVRAAVLSKPAEKWPWVKPPSEIARPGSGHTASTERSSMPLGIPAALVVLLVLLTAFGLARPASGESRPAPVDWGAVLLISSAGAAIRILTSPRSFMHEYYHIVDFMHDALSRDDGFFHYGGGGPVLYRFSALFGGAEEAVFRVTFVCAVLTLPAVMAFVAAVSGRTAGIVAGVLLATAPIHLRFSYSEEMTVPGLLFAAWGLAAAAWWWRTGRTLWLATTVVALAMAAHTRPELLVLPAVVAGVVFTDRSKWRERLWSGRFLVAAAALVVLVFPRVLFILGSPRDPTDFMLAAKAMPGRWALIDFVALPPVWIAGAGAGFLLLLRSRPFWAIWLVASAVGYALLGLSYFQNPPPYSWRMQLVTLPFLLALVGGAVEWLESRPVSWRAGVVAGVLGIASFSLSSRLPDVERLTDQQVEFAWVKSKIPELPETATLLAVREQRMRSLDAFPIYLLERAKKSIDVLDLDGLVEKGEWPAPSDSKRLLYYEGMPCYFAFRDEPVPTPLHPRCKAVRERYRLVPVATQVVEAPSSSPLSYAEGPWTIGFYELVRAPPPEPVPQ